MAYEVTEDEWLIVSRVDVLGRVSQPLVGILEDQQDVTVARPRRAAATTASASASPPASAMPGAPAPVSPIPVTPRRPPAPPPTTAQRPAGEDGGAAVDRLLKESTPGR